MLGVFCAEKVPQSSSAVTAVYQPDPVGAASGPAQQGVHSDFGLIGIFSVKILRQDTCLNGTVSSLLPVVGNCRLA